MSVVRVVVLAALGAGVCGFAAGYRTASSPGWSRESAGDRDHARERESTSWDVLEERVARRCVSEILRLQEARPPAQPARAEGSTGARASTRGEASREQEGLRDQLDQVFVLVEDKGLWSRGAGAKARYLLSQLPPGDARLLRERLDAAAESGTVRLQTGAWLPLAVSAR